MTLDKALTRRRVLGGATAAAAFTLVPRHVLGGPGHTAPSEKVNVAAIGFGGMGASNLRQLESQNIVALCDVDPGYAAQVFARYPQARRYRDYRVMLAEQPDIDAVLIATPDHSHAPITIACMRAGKHVYCQKPLTHTVREAREVARVARETGVVTQLGIQGHSGEGLQRIREWIADGAIGAVRRVDAWCSLTYWPPGHAGWCTTHYEVPQERPPVPPELDWNLWLGPAPERAYHPTYHPARWRAWYDFGCGMMGDRGVHTLDCVFTALKLEQPTAVSATVSNVSEQTHPFSSIVTYDVAARGDRPPVRITWYEGLEAPRPDELEDAARLPAEGGVLFRGDRGTLMCGVYGNSPRLIPQARMKAYRRPPQTLPRIRGSHEMEWIQAIREGRRANADFRYGGPLTEFVLLGNVAKRLRTKLHYDAHAQSFPGRPDADRYLATDYRTGW